MKCGETVPCHFTRCALTACRDSDRQPRTLGFSARCDRHLRCGSRTHGASRGSCRRLAARIHALLSTRSCSCQRSDAVTALLNHPRTYHEVHFSISDCAPALPRTSCSVVHTADAHEASRPPSCGNALNAWSDRHIYRIACPPQAADGRTPATERSMNMDSRCWLGPNRAGRLATRATAHDPKGPHKANLMRRRHPVSLSACTRHGKRPHRVLPERKVAVRHPSPRARIVRVSTSS